MVDAAFIEARVHGALPHAEVHPTDLTGGGDHWHVAIVDAGFEGQRPLARQRTVLAAFQDALADGRVHALDLKCLTPDELRKRHGGRPPAPFAPH